jgi:hypothetical protein
MAPVCVCRRAVRWRHPVIIDLAGLTIPSQARPIRFGHDPLSGVGHTDTIRVEGGQLIAVGVVSRDTPAAREVVVSSKNGFPWQASVGAGVDEFEFIKEGLTVTVNGTQYSGPVNVVRKSSLGEISFVDLGADGATSASVAAEARISSGEDIVDASSAVDSNDVAPMATLPQVDSAAVEPGEDVAASIESLRSAHAAETERIAAIRRICGGRLPKLEAQAIRDGWNEQRTELEALRVQRPAVAAVHVPDNTVSSAVLEAACMLAAGYRQIEEEVDPQSLELAARRFRGGIGLQELLSDRVT